MGLRIAMKKLTRKMKRLLEALALADNGRERPSEVPRHSPERPTGEDGALVAGSGSRRNRQVVLVAGDELGSELLTYTIETCSEVDASLVIVRAGLWHDLEALVEPFRATLSLAAIPYELVALTAENSSAALEEFLHVSSRLQFVIVDGDHDELGLAELQRRDRWQPAVPLVVVKDQPKPANPAGSAAARGRSIEIRSSK